MSDSPKPKPPINKKATKPTATEEKKPFVRKAHLMHRPFSNEALAAKLRAMDNTTPRRGKKGTDK